MKRSQSPFLIGPGLFALSFLIPSDIFSLQEKAMVGILLWMLTWWVTEIVNLAVTALLPILLIPMTGILPIGDVTKVYGHPLIYLFFGGFVIALAIEKWNLHRRIALWIIRHVGHSPKRILLGFMLATAFLSAWISNTATTVMMLPMVLSVLQLLKKAGYENRKTNIALLIGVAWAANIGGMSTLIGTPPNLVFTGFYSQEFGVEMSFSEWLKVGLPVAGILFFIAYYLLAFMMRKGGKSDKSVQEFFEAEWKQLGKLEGPELKVAIIFGLTAFMWIFRPQIVSLLNLQGFSDTSVAIFSSILLFVTPATNGERLLIWKDTKKLAWGILVLFGGGLALAAGMNESGLLDHITNALANQSDFSILLWIFTMAVLGIWATEVMSNMALVAAMMPIVAAISVGANIEFFTLALPLTLGASCAFMLPMATPPNAIVFSSGQLKIVDMVKNGVVLNAIATVVITALTYLLTILF